MIWTKEQLINNLIKHILNDDSFVYYAKDLEDNTFKVSYKPFKDATKIETKYSNNYYKDNFEDYINEGFYENDDTTEEEQQKAAWERLNDTDEFKNYLENAITELHLIPNKEIDI